MLQFTTQRNLSILQASTSYPEYAIITSSQSWVRKPTIYTCQFHLIKWVCDLLECCTFSQNVVFCCMLDFGRFVTCRNTSKHMFTFTQMMLPSNLTSKIMLVKDNWTSENFFEVIGERAVRVNLQLLQAARMCYMK